jgi:predicted phage tail protein
MGLELWQWAARQFAGRFPCVCPAGAYAVKLWATGTNGCASDTISVIVSAHKAMLMPGGYDCIEQCSFPAKWERRGHGTVAACCRT